MAIGVECVALRDDNMSFEEEGVVELARDESSLTSWGGIF